MPHFITAHHLRPRGTLAFALILTTAHVGCGGGDEDSRDSRDSRAKQTATVEPTPREASLSHSEFVARLNETCTGDAARIDQLYAELADRLRAYDYPAARRSMQDLSDLVRANWQEQRTLKPPAQDAAAFATYMDSQRQFLGVRRRLVAATREGDVRQMTLLFEWEQEVRQARLKAAVALGADECGA